jgi:hypothetical protein
VDINNISQIQTDGTIYVDEKGYPVCDKSIEALYLLEKGFTKSRTIDREPLYQPLWDTRRMKQVNHMEKLFHEAYSGLQARWD